MTFIESMRGVLNAMVFKSSNLTSTEAAMVNNLRECVERLEAVVDQAEAQFQCGDTHATFNKEFIRVLNKQ